MNALVTGGSGALGGAICRVLAREGHVVAVGYHTNRAVADRLVAELEDRGARSVAIGFDVADPRATGDAVDRAAADMGGLDILVHAAAQQADGLVWDLASHRLARILAVNLAGAF